MRIVTIGYEGRSVEDFVADLDAQGVNLVVDVRETPLSRKAGFSKRQLSEHLQAAGIDYVHERDLGNPKDNRDPFRAGEAGARERYRQHMTRSPQALARLVDLVESATVALLCYERSHDECHRGVVAEAVRAEIPSAQLVTV